VNYRPICDTWILARPKVPYYGAYPNGFLERAKALLGVHVDDAVLHVCGGRAKQYPAWKKLCPHDYTLDVDPKLKPDFVQDARFALPLRPVAGPSKREPWHALLCDPPYTEADAKQYAAGSDCLPSATTVLRLSLHVVRPGGRVGVLHYVAPRPPEGVRLVALIGVVVGFENRIRVYSVFERRE
jgi:hypothetical protein